MAADDRKVKADIATIAESTKKLADGAGGVGGGGSFGASTDTGVGGVGGPNLRYGRDPSGNYRRGGHGGGGRDYADTPNGQGRAGDVKGDMARRAMAAMTYLVEKKGYTPEGAAIAVGNAMQESSVNAGTRPGDSGISHSMFQWNHERWAAYQKFSAERGKSTADNENALDFFDEERKRRSGLEAQWDKQKDLRNAGRLGHLYEGYGDNSEGTRVQNATNLLDLWRKKGPAPTAMAPTPAGTSSAAISDAEVFAARQRMWAGGTNPRDMEIVKKYLQQQNIPKLHTSFAVPPSGITPSLQASYNNSRTRGDTIINSSPTFNVSGGDVRNNMEQARMVADRGTKDLIRNVRAVEV